MKGFVFFNMAATLAIIAFLMHSLSSDERAAAVTDAKQAVAHISTDTERTIQRLTAAVSQSAQERALSSGKNVSDIAAADPKPDPVPSPPAIIPVKESEASKPKEKPSAPAPTAQNASKPTPIHPEVARRRAEIFKDDPGSSLRPIEELQSQARQQARIQMRRELSRISDDMSLLSIR